MRSQRLSKSVAKSFELPSIAPKNKIKLTPIIHKVKAYPKKPTEEVIKSLPVIQMEEVKEKEKDFIFQTQFEYISTMEKKIRNMAEIFKVSTGMALNLLIKNQYKTETCYEEAFEYQRNRNWTELRRYYNLTDGLINQICPICMQDTPPKQLISLNCYHRFCRSCFFNYLVSLMKDEGIFCFHRTCPMEGCKEYLTFEIFDELLKNDLVLLRQYHHYLTKLLLDTMPRNQKLCPQKNCSYIVTLENPEKTTVVCPNNHHFCFKCLNYPHLPLTCKEFSFFNATSNLDDLLDKNWIYSNSKPCPSCNTNIEKNEGCNHMTCKRCSHQFCWLCLQNWTKHNSKLCGNYHRDLKARTEDKMKNLTQKLKFLKDLQKIRDQFIRNKQISMSMHKHYQKMFASEPLLSKQEFDEYLVFLTELESFLFLAENYSKFVEVNKTEKFKILKKVKEIYNKLVRVNLSVRLLHDSISMPKIYKSLIGIKNNEFNQKLFNQIKPLMNEVLHLTAEKNHELNKVLR